MTEIHPVNLGRRRFTLADQERFAVLSGDRNPMHLDALQARRTQAGAPVVHGVHAALWALDRLYGPGGETRPPRTLSVRFDRFIYLDEEVEAIAAYATSGRIDLSILIGGMRAALVSVGFEPQAARPNLATREPVASPGQAIELTASEMASARGSFALAQPDAAASAAFPALAAVIGPETVNSLAALSTLVGMHCPGLHSIFSKFNVRLLPEESGDGILDYCVARFQPMLRLAAIHVRAPGIAGSVEAFLRQPPIRQPSTSELAGRVARGAMEGARILVVGGSRGLGELTAKLTALGGAEVTISYATGSEDAAAVAEDIRATGRHCATIPLDVRRPLVDQLSGQPGFSHIYYFATPAIFRKHSELYAHDALIDFLDIYVRAFSDLCVWADGAGRPARLFYPSSVAVEEVPKGAAEYAMAKAAGEILCRELSRGLKAVDILVERLPRLATDQTSTVLPVECADSIGTMLPIIRRMHDLV